MNTIVCQLYHVLKPSYEIDIDRELGKVLSETTEIAYYKEKDQESFKKTVKMLRDFYEKNK